MPLPNSLRDINNEIVGNVIVIGQTVKGKAVLADVSQLVHIDKESVSYQWFRNKEAISGANSILYSITEMDVGKQLYVIACFVHNGEYFIKRSEYTDMIENDNSITHRRYS